MTVLAFPDRSREKLVYRCECGCMTHFMLADGGVECANCSIVSNVVRTSGAWCERVAPDAPREEAVEPHVIVDLGIADLALARVRRAMGDSAALAAAVAIRKDGTLSAWADIETTEQHEWLRERLASVPALFEPKEA